MIIYVMFFMAFVVSFLAIYAFINNRSTCKDEIKDLERKIQELEKLVKEN